VWDEAGNLVLDLYVEDLFEEVSNTIRHGLIERYAIAPSDIGRTRREGRDMALARLAANPHHQPVRDVVAETKWWHCFQSEDIEPDETATAIEPCSDPHCNEHAVPALTVRRGAPKISRNDPCPCGSGKKYKKCCLLKT
jgi:preprotein translocase subunit SecA